MTRIAQALEQMDGTLAEIEAKVGGLSAAWPRWRPAPEVWSILDNLCHIEEFIPYWTEQIMAIVSVPAGEWGRTHADADRLAAVAHTDSRDPRGVLASIRARFDAMKQQLLALDDSLLDTLAPSRNPRWGTKPAAFVLEQLLVHHLASHSRQIQRNLDQLKAIGLAEGSERT